MLSIVIIILLIQQFYPTYQLKTIQATLASTVELPCSTIIQNTELINPAKVNYIKKKKRRISRGIDDNNDIMSCKNSW